MCILLLMHQFNRAVFSNRSTKQKKTIIFHVMLLHNSGCMLFYQKLNNKPQSHYTQSTVGIGYKTQARDALQI